MSQLSKRVTALETVGQVSLSAVVKAWLGWPLTAVEQQAFDAGGNESAAAEIDKSEWSQEAKAWLGVG